MEVKSLKNLKDNRIKICLESLKNTSNIKMKKPRFDMIDRLLMRNDDILVGARLNLALAVLHFKRDIEMLNPMYKIIKTCIEKIKKLTK